MMALAPGTRFGSYEVTELLGTGGMGEVYRATDSTLERDVAIKVLPEVFAADAGRVERFGREARMLAALNHPNVAQIYGLERAGGHHALVMELVEGPTLADRIAQGPVPADEALGIARQIADALEAAHAQGIVHRDLKPANVKLRPDGAVKVLDFGIAKAFEPQALASGPQSPVLTTPATQAGVILGTAAYMSPEQARGRPVDERADIWAFGCVLYEMLTGQPAFAGEDVTITLARVLERDTDIDSLPGALSPAARHTIGLCLQKDPAKRIADIRDVRLALAGAFVVESAQRTDATVAARPVWRRALPSVATAMVAVAVTAVAAWLAMRPAPAPTNRFGYSVPDGRTLRNTGRPVLALSPDGRHFVYNASEGLYLRPMDQLEARLIPGTEEPLTSPIFSPDGQSIAYFANGDLKRIAISGGAPVVVAEDLTNPFGTSWQADGTIWLAQPEGIVRVSANGGTPELVIAARDGEQIHGAQLLPGGDSVLFSTTTVPGDWDAGRVVVESLVTGERTVLVEGGSDPKYLPTGHLVYALGDGLFAIAVDVDSLTVSGGAVPLVQGVMRAALGFTGAANYAVSRDGTLMYIGGQRDYPERTLVWVDRVGREEPIDVPPRNYQYAQLSPDGTRIALDVRQDENDIWIWDLERETLQRLTFDPGQNRGGIWSPDGERVAFSRSIEGSEEVYWQAADGSGMPEPLTADSVDAMLPNGFTPDGASLIYWNINDQLDVWIVDVGGPPNEGKRLIAGPADELGGAVSPDGRWLAYQSNESGQHEVYVRPLPDVGSGRWQISTGGGTRPLWRRDGGELFYIVNRGGTISVMGVSVEPGERFRPGAPATVIEGQYEVPNTGRHIYDVSLDGQRFLMIQNLDAAGEATTTQFVVVQNFFAELRRLVPTD